jgi:hypothetical protein
VYTFLISPICATCSSHFILLDLIILIFCEECKLCSSSLCNFIHPPVTSSLLERNILQSSLFSNIFNCYCLNVRDQVAHPYKTTHMCIISKTPHGISLSSHILSTCS